MPKLIVLFQSEDKAAASLAENAAAGAKGVRFTEVEIRSVGSGDGHKVLESPSNLRDYDGVLFVHSGDELPEEAHAQLAELASGGQLPNTVFGLTGMNANALQSVARTGGIIVSEQAGSDAADRAHKLGARMAKVVGWVRHALGHEAAHNH